MLELLFAFALCGGTYLALRGGFAATNGFTIAGYDTPSMGIGLLAILAAGYLFGPLYGVAVIFSVMIHEFGHVAAYRIAGHRDAGKGLLHHADGARHMPGTDGDGLCPLHFARRNGTLGCGISVDLRPDHRRDQFLQSPAVLAARRGPLYQDYRRDFRTRLVSLAMSGAMAAAAVYMQSLLLFMFALMGTQGMMQAENLSRVQRRMSRPRGALCAAAYAFTAAAHFSVGWPFLSGYL
jgi:hypothetical protein